MSLSALLRSIAGLVAMSGACPCVANCQDAEPIRLELQCVVDRDGLRDLTATIANVSAAPRAVLVGLRLGNGQSYHATAMTIEAFVGGSVTSDDFDFSLGFVGGRMDPWVVPLPEGARYTWTVRSDRFQTRTTHTTLSDASLPTDIVLRMELRPITDIAVLEGFVGTIRSSRVRVPDGCRKEE